MKRLTVAVIALLATSSIADAACTLSDFAGRWRTYAFGQVSSSKQAFYIICTLSINTRARLSGSCTNSANQSYNISGRVTAAELQNCTALFDLSGNDLAAVTLAPDKNTGAGVGSAPGALYSFTATKI